MWNYEKRLQYPVNIKTPNAKIAQIIMSQYGGPDGEMGASMRYLSQRYSAPNRTTMAVLTDVGREASEMEHSLCCYELPFIRQHIKIHINMVFIVDYHFVKQLCVIIIFILNDAVYQFIYGFFNILHLFCWQNSFYRLSQIIPHFLTVHFKIPADKIHQINGVFISDTFTEAANPVSGPINMRTAMFYCLKAAPSLILTAVFSGSISGNIARSAPTAFDFTREGITAAVL